MLLTIAAVVWGGVVAYQVGSENASLGGSGIGVVIFFGIVIAAPSIAIAVSVRRGSSFGWWAAVVVGIVGVITQSSSVWRQGFGSETLIGMICSLLYLGLLVHPSTMSWIRQSTPEHATSFLTRHRGLLLVTVLAVIIAMLTVTCAFLSSTPSGSTRTAPKWKGVPALRVGVDHEH